MVKEGALVTDKIIDDINKGLHHLDSIRVKRNLEFMLHEKP